MLWARLLAYVTGTVNQEAKLGVDRETLLAYPKDIPKGSTPCSRVIMLEAHRFVVAQCAPQ